MAGTKKTNVAAEPKKVDKKSEKTEKKPEKVEKPEKAEKKLVKADKAGGLKRNMNAYMFFTKDFRAEHAGEGLKVTETARAAGVAWTALKDKSKYEKMAAADKVRYEKEMAAAEGKSK